MILKLFVFELYDTIIYPWLCLQVSIHGFHVSIVPIRTIHSGSNHRFVRSEQIVNEIIVVRAINVERQASGWEAAVKQRILFLDVMHVIPFENLVEHVCSKIDRESHTHTVHVRALKVVTGEHHHFITIVFRFEIVPYQIIGQRASTLQILEPVRVEAV